MHHHLTAEDRSAIGVMLGAGYRKAAIGRAVGVHASTITREIERNGGRGYGYHSWRAHGKARTRRRSAKAGCRKIENDPVLAGRIEDLLDPLVSPETAAHELGICHETIYAWISRSRRDLLCLLPRRGRKRRRYGSKREAKQGWTRHVRPIEELPRTGTVWEGDTIKGKGRARILTYVEKESLFLAADRLLDGTADSVQMIMRDKHGLRGNSILYDRGGEFALWRMIEEDTGATVYFAHPHYPWERGRNENTNGRLRRVFPRSMNFDTITRREVDRVVWKMNHTKRTSLFWRTPCAVYGKCCVSS